MYWNNSLWNEIDRMRRDMDKVFSNYGRTIDKARFPLVNIYDKQDNVVVTAELPGLIKENVSITFTGNVLTISGKIDTPAKTKNMTMIRQERSYGEFEKSLRIPAKIEQNRISALFNNGILTITMPKSEEAKPRTITIKTEE